MFSEIKPLYPLRHYVNIPQVAQRTKEFPAGLLQFLPCRMWVKRPQAVRHRAAAAQRDSEIVYWIGSKFAADLVAFLEHLLHPVEQAVALQATFACLHTHFAYC